MKEKYDRFFCLKAGLESWIKKLALRVGCKSWVRKLGQKVGFKPMYRLLSLVQLVLLICLVTACDSSEEPPVMPDQPRLQSESVTKKPDKPASIWVYIDNSAIQCEYSGKALNETAALLRASNIEVEASRCGTITGTMMMTVCGTKDLNIHLHRIPKTALGKAMAKGFASVDAMGHGGSKSYKVGECPPYQ